MNSNLVILQQVLIMYFKEINLKVLIHLHDLLLKVEAKYVFLSYLIFREEYYHLKNKTLPLLGTKKNGRILEDERWKIF